jgi:hypothetical protein
MIIIVTHIELRSLWGFFSLSNHARKILAQMKGHSHTGFKKTGRGKNHYTMSRWNNREEMMAFVRSGAHLSSMKKAGKFAAQIRTVSLDREDFPDWQEARTLLSQHGRVIRY